MDDIRDTRPWFWVLFLLVFGVALAGLLLAITAKSDAVDENQVVKEATAEIKGELSGLNGAIEAADEFQQQQQEEATRDKRRITKQVDAATADAERRLNKLSKRVGSLESETSELGAEDVSLRNRVDKLGEEQTAIDAELARINQRLRNLSSEGL